MNFVLGCATGSTMRVLYEELCRMHREEGLSFKNVVTFNLDEYASLPRSSPHSYYQEMRKQLVDRVDMPVENFNILPSEFSFDKTSELCVEYEERIKAAGGIDYQLLGIGRTGHIGFNEPFSDEMSGTRLVHLSQATRIDAAPAFGGLSNVPTMALSMGVKTIMQARQITIMAWTEDKAEIVAKAIEGPINSAVTCSYLHRHENAKFILDMASASRLSRFMRPWVVPGFTDVMKDRDFWDKKAIIWLSLTANKPILRLTRENYEANGMLPLINIRGNGNHEHCNLWGFKSIEKCITGWPAGGRPEGRMAYFDSPSSTCGKNVLVMSPHPDDDSICMAGTIQKLVKQGHNVHCAEMTSGNYAVFNHDAHKFVDFVNELGLFQGDSTDSARVLKDIEEAMKNKEEANPLLKKVKGLIRRVEARQSLIQLGVLKSNVHHLDLPFYEVHSSQKGAITEKDITIIIDLIK